jgi:hypothetical protein
VLLQSCGMKNAEAQRGMEIAGFKPYEPNMP